MGKKYNGKLDQGFYMVINMEKLYDAIADGIQAALEEDKQLIEPEIDEWETDDDNLQLTGSYSCRYSGEYFAATLESPAEDDLSRPFILNEGENECPEDISKALLAKLPEGLRDLIQINYINEPEEEMDFEDEDYDF